MSHSLEVVRSSQNARIKRLRKYLQQSHAEETPWVALEGWKAIQEAARRARPRLLVRSEEFQLGRTSLRADEELVVDSRVLRALSPLESSTGVIAFFEKPQWDWAALPAVLLYLDRLQDPGNLGTLMRCAAAAAPAGIVTSPGTVSRFNWKALRASAGTLFSVPVREKELPRNLIGQGYRLVAACPEDGEPVFEAELTPPLAIAIGNEGEGLAPEVLRAAQARVHIPVAPGAPSLNAAVAGAVILFEVRRRGGFL